MNTDRHEAQEQLFAARPARLALLELAAQPAPAARQIGVGVWRNHAFEPVAGLLPGYAHFGGYAVDFALGDYDDRLDFAGHRRRDAELVWLDSSRYLARMTPADWLEWLGQRLARLRQLTTAPILLATWAADATLRHAIGEVCERLPATHFCDLGALAAAHAVKLLDARSAALAGTPLAAALHPLAARALACRWLPAAVLPPIKAVAVDLDHTLHDGVLGEDGIAGVRLSAAHRALHDDLRALRRRGVFLALVSRNERRDVDALFAERSDYPLRPDDFSAIEVSWGDKAEALQRVAAQLRIAPEALLFIDDNPGELASVAGRLPGLPTLRALPDAEATRRALADFPGLWRWRGNAEDAVRADDLAANAARTAALADAPDDEAYFAGLDTRLAIGVDLAGRLPRLAEISQKTNQFNLALSRFNEADLAARLADPAAAVAAVGLSDRLADSGLIALVVARREARTLVVEEVCISCRALGRRLEDALVLETLRRLPILAGCATVSFTVRHGPRNRPALDWLARLLGGDAPPDAGRHDLDAARIGAYRPPATLHIEALEEERP